MKRYLLILLLLALSACKKHTDTSPEPGIAKLIFPEQNSLCISGDVVSATESNVILKWNPAANADSYAVSVKNLLSNDVVTKTTKTNQLSLTLLRNTPYSWSVVSRSSQSKVYPSSAVWKFHNSGPGIVSHIPFPADLLSPSFAQKINGPNVNLTWSGSDVDQDIEAYDVYFGTSATPPVYFRNLTIPQLHTIPVQAGQTYFWRITTTDEKGNQSSSETFQFTVN